MACLTLNFTLVASVRTLARVSLKIEFHPFTLFSLRVKSRTQLFNATPLTNIYILILIHTRKHQPHIVPSASLDDADDHSARCKM